MGVHKVPIQSDHGRSQKKIVRGYSLQNCRLEFVIPNC